MKRTRIAGLTPEDLLKVKSLKKTDCPRCYCWWWRSNKFEFEIPAIKGCKVDELLFQKNPREPSVCARATGNPYDRDLHEPYESHLSNDGFSPLHFFGIQAGKTYVWLDVSDFDDDPNEITRIIGLEPTKSWKMGDPAAPNSIYVCCQSGWRLYSNLPLSESVELHLDNLLSKLELDVDRVKQASNKFAINIQIIDKDHHMKKVKLSNRVLQRIYNLGLSIEFVHDHIDYELQEE